MFFLVSYVLMIPIFAACYNAFADEFFHSTSQFEAEILEDGRSIREDLTAIARGQFNDVYDGPIKEVDGWIMDVRELDIIRAAFDGNKLYFSAFMRFRRGNTSEIGGAKLFYIDAHPSYILELPHSQEQVAVKILYSDEESDGHWPVPVSDVFPTSIPGVVTNEVGALGLPVELQERITAQRDSFLGFPSRSTGTFGRLLYFSAVTQTTLGFGDIVPISDRTRLAVATQSVLGIVLIGLFLNSLAQPRSSRT